MQPLSSFPTIKVDEPNQSAAYCRKAAPTERQAISIETQKRSCLQVATEAGITLNEADVHVEASGYSANDWWADVAHAAETNARCRPVLSVIVEGITAGKIKRLFVRSLDRLFRDPAMAEVLIQILSVNDVRLYDKNGIIPLDTDEMRASLMQSIRAARHQSVVSAVASPRAINKRLEAGQLVTNPICLGFRSGGNGSAKVIHVEAEQVTVRYLYDLFVHGDDAEGAMGIESIAARLTDEGFCWPDGLHRKRGKTRNDYTADIIYAFQVKRLLTDCRYVGMQQYGGEKYPCPAYLYNDETIVPQALFDAAQIKIASKRRTKTKSHPQTLSSKVRCGFCGQALHARSVQEGGTGEKITVFRVGQARTWTWCDHQLPHVPAAVLDAYVEALVLPLAQPDLNDCQIDNSLPVNAKREMVRAQVMWIAVLPVTETQQSADDAGLGTPLANLVLLTTDGLYHHALLCSKPTEHQITDAVILPASPQERIGTIADFPDVPAFVAGLERTCAGRGVPFDKQAWVPGYDEEPMIAEFKA